MRHSQFFRWIFGTAILACLAAQVQAQIYGGADGNGRVVLSNFSTVETPELIIAPPAAVEISPQPGKLLEVPLTADPRDPAGAYRLMIEQVAQEVSVSPRLLHAVIQVESGYQPKAVSRKGAMGMMQLMPKTAARFGVHDAFDPMQNVRGGALYLKWLLEYFHGDLHLVLAAYNAGELAVVRAGYRIPPIAETVDYVPKVLWFLNRPTNG